MLGVFTDKRPSRFSQSEIKREVGLVSLEYETRKVLFGQFSHFGMSEPSRFKKQSTLIIINNGQWGKFWSQFGGILINYFWANWLKAFWYGSKLTILQFYKKVEDMPIAAMTLDRKSRARNLYDREIDFIRKTVPL